MLENFTKILNDNEPTMMTIWFGKLTGEIKSFNTSKVSWEALGEHVEEIKLACDMIHTEFVKDFVENFSDYKVVKGELKRKKNPLEELKEENERLKQELVGTKKAVDFLMSQQEMEL